MAAVPHSGCARRGAAGPVARLLLIAALPALPVSAGDLFSLLRRAAEGDETAQLAVGLIYLKGETVPRDEGAAFRWVRRAAARGYAEAENELGLMYAAGLGVEEDDREAVRWYRRAAAQGHARAQLNLGRHYLRGEGVARDLREMLRWHRRAAARGLADAQYNLGAAHERGRGVARDARAAVAWHRKAAEQGHARAQTDLGYIHATGSGVPRDDIRAHAWTALAAAQGVDIARRNLAVLDERLSPARRREAEALMRARGADRRAVAGGPRYARREGRDGMKPTAPGVPRDGGGKRPERLRGPFLVAKNRAGHVLLTPCPQPGAPQIGLRTRPAKRG